MESKSEVLCERVDIAKHNHSKLQYFVGCAHRRGCTFPEVFRIMRKKFILIIMLTRTFISCFYIGLESMRTSSCVHHDKTQHK